MTDNSAAQSIGNILGAIYEALGKGDVASATRLYSQLLQVNESGRKVDVRHHHIWALGAEILMRTGEEPMRAAAATETYKWEELPQSRGVHRWGLAENMPQVREYYTRLINQYPYDHHRPDMVNAVDFWLALLRCEVYNAQAELQDALHSSLTGAEGEMEHSATQAEELDETEAHVTKSFGYNRPRLLVSEVQEQTLNVLRGLAKRIDELSLDRPYSELSAFADLRVMISTNIADLKQLA